MYLKRPYDTGVELRIKKVDVVVNRNIYCCCAQEYIFLHYDPQF
jgi:hypothetical protein